MRRGITADQWDAVRELLKMFGVPQRSFLDFYGVSRPREVPKDRLAEGLRALALKPPAEWTQERTSGA